MTVQAADPILQKGLLGGATSVAPRNKAHQTVHVVCCAQSCFLLLEESLPACSALLTVVSLQQAISPCKDRLKEQLSGNADPEMQEVQNLPFESATLKAEHYHWSEKCSSGIQQMLATRQQRHDASLQAYLTIRCAAKGLNAAVIRVF